MMNNEEYIQEYTTTRGLSRNTYNLIKLVMNHYSQFQKLTLHELIIEADDEEEQGIRWKRRTLKRRLINYINHLHQSMTLNSAKTYLKIVKSFYHHHEIEIHSLPKLNEKNALVNEPMTFKDLPDREIIKNACEIASPLMKSLILFLSSTGLSKVDVLNLTLKDFIEATYPYHHSKDIVSAVQKMYDSDDDIIPTFKGRRQKTNKYFITFCTAEATREILQYLMSERLMKNNKIDKADKLFKIEPHYYSKKFQELNDALRLDKVGTYNRFRGHMLRKFHASMLEQDGMNRILINTLQGKSNNAVDDVYFFTDEDNLREEYLKHMSCLLIFTEVKTVDKYSDEYVLLKKENDALKKQVDKIKELQNEIESIKEWMI